MLKDIKVRIERWKLLPAYFTIFTYRQNGKSVYRIIQ